MDTETLGPCGCTDYHMADCDLGGAWFQQAVYDEQWPELEPPWWAYQ